MNFNIRAQQHSRTMTEVIELIPVRFPALEPSGKLSALVFSATGRRARFRRHGGPISRSCGWRSSAHHPYHLEPHFVFNAPIPSEWVRDYRLGEKNGGLRAHTLAPINQLGIVTETHVEECAAATYGCLVKGETSGKLSKEVRFGLSVCKWRVLRSMFLLGYSPCYDRKQLSHYHR